MIFTRALWLSTRFRQRAFEGEACLLVYDEQEFDDLLVSRDIKTVFDSRASTAHIYVVAPFVTTERVFSALAAGGSLQRVSPYMSAVGGEFRVVGIDLCNGRRRVVSTQVSWLNGAMTRADPIRLPDELRQGWLFDLFHRYEGLVQAPPGVHFRKTSGKHSPRFLRTANILTTSSACGLLGLFCLEQIDTEQPRRVLVDTAPLISVAFAMARVARAANFWAEDIPVKSFGSYGGLHSIGRLSANDVVLISASTSGGLAEELRAAGARERALVTLYYIGSGHEQARPAQVLCDLGAAPQRTFGYGTIPSYTGSNCPMCQAGSLAVELEGDQFLLQQREHRRIEILKASQPADAREAADVLARGSLLRVVTRSSSPSSTVLSIDGDRLLQIPVVREKLIRSLRRFCPKPLDVLVRVGVSPEQLATLFDDAGLGSMLVTAQVVEPGTLAQMNSVNKGGALVLFGLLQDHALARSINASLRAIVPQGVVAYLSALTLADSAEHLGDLKRFIQFGDSGPESFTYRDCMALAFPLREATPSPWDMELRLLNELCGADDSPVELTQRKAWLEANETASDDLFWAGRSGPLTIQNDFVYVNTKQERTSISQGDVFAVVGNLLATARCYNHPLTATPAARGEPTRLAASVYGHVLLCPSNFRRYNDAVVRAALLRVASVEEMQYEVDEACSEEMTAVVLVEVEAWKNGQGDALPEFLIALATHRLRLDARHSARVRMALADAMLPAFMQQLAARIPV